jgi:rhodanese-related sulfurtransferase
MTAGLALNAIYSAHTMTLSPRAFRIILVCSLLFTCMGLFGCSNADAQDAVSLEFARTEHEAGRAVLIDIREPSEHVTGVAKGAQLLPMSQLNSRLGEIPKDSGNPVLLICNTQNRSSSTLTALKKAGYTNVKYVNGGMSGWVQRGWPTVKP